MTKFNRVQRLLRKVKCLRRLALIDLKRTRQHWQVAHWTYQHSVLANVGLLITTWSGIERMLNTLIVQYHPVAPEGLRKRKLPSVMATKIDYLGEVARDTRLPEPLRSAIDEWLPDLQRLSQHRNLIAHGNLFQRNERTLEWRVQELVLKGREPAFAEHVFTNDELNQKVTEISGLAHQMALTLNPLLVREIPPVRLR